MAAAAMAGKDLLGGGGGVTPTSLQCLQNSSYVKCGCVGPWSCVRMPGG